ncbi:(2Fe-2S) ferredoxin domain-containing protein [Massilimicrobiota timonensis]|uniref:(2Fe-2S) ferredoxin domain-containing protein n=1 Tax=Massilimicrobiota timonensis TaxID=1776392 RepID=UPI0019608213|nr:(2Fe-2S) ferredoxin domain-containing protein [Massilimicrobiota timonensis]MBM6965840.1 (2Fe-2S) ferredoxin domain-containing protein [Massilimicrobiota timonensis]
MKSLDELKKIREQAKERMAVRGQEGQEYRVVVGMATCGIAAGARPVLNTFVQEVAKEHLPVTVMQTGCIGMCALEPIVEIFDKDNQKTTYVLIDEKKAKDIVLRHLMHGEVIDEYTVGHYSK